MNKQEIDSLSGRALDMAIEKYVFGNDKPAKARDKWGWLQNSDGIWQCEQQDCIDGEWQRSWSVVEWPPEYHKSDYLAFKVVEKILDDNQQRFAFDLYFGTLSHKWCAEFFEPRRNFNSSDKSRPTAICRAALKVVCSD